MWDYSRTQEHLIRGVSLALEVFAFLLVAPQPSGTGWLADIAILSLWHQVLGGSSTKVVYPCDCLIIVTIQQQSEISSFLARLVASKLIWLTEGLDVSSPSTVSLVLYPSLVSVERLEYCFANLLQGFDAFADIRVLASTGHELAKLDRSGFA